jgi:FkbM family methyltransferase
MIQQITGSDGLPFYIPDGASNVVIDAIRAGTWWEVELLPLFKKVCRPNHWTVEVGAYVGDHTIALAQLGPVLAIEPQPLLWSLLGLNLALRTFPYAWETRCTALYSRRVNLVLSPDWHAENSPSSAYQVADVPTPTQAIAFPQLYFPHEVGFLKIDAQGCDLQILRGAESVIARDRPIILCEYYPPLAKLHGDDSMSYGRWFEQHRNVWQPDGGDNLLAVPAEIDPDPYWEILR